jgi:hypothetical protein
MGASAIACFPDVSIPEAGGPGMPVTMAKVTSRVPLAEVVAVWARGFEQPTGTWLPATDTVGS